MNKTIEGIFGKLSQVIVFCVFVFLVAYGFGQHPTIAQIWCLGLSSWFAHRYFRG